MWKLYEDFHILHLQKYGMYMNLLNDLNIYLFLKNEIE